ncbi:MAG: RibD family protein [Mesorhizobium sp.]|uniref:RibD family protein n=1 Tax=Mesorhizobium sp. TaxID=1871066 RepID=UPI001AD5CA47|nr:RibD family protein [Mesorhizobium sp.]MBN9216719.1 RibD family protein [Mesorhizobium sp.]
MKPHVICHMLASLDGSLHPSRYTASPDGGVPDWSGLYEKIHGDLEGDAWIVGRVTMAEMSKAAAHPPAQAGKVDRPYHFARRDAGSFAVALDASGKLHFSKPDIGGDHVVVLLGSGVPDSHLAELAADGVSYIVSESADIDLAAMLDVLARELGIRRLLLEGGAGINGSFLAAGLVDELSLLVAPALDARAGNQGFVEFGESGLAGKMQLSLKGCEALAHGLVHLRYAVSAG